MFSAKDVHVFKPGKPSVIYLKKAVLAPVYEAKNGLKE